MAQTNNNNKKGDGESKGFCDNYQNRPSIMTFQAEMGNTNLLAIQKSIAPYGFLVKIFKKINSISKAPMYLA